MKDVIKFVGLVILVIIMALLVAWAFQYLWNGVLIHAVTFAKPIDYWSAFAIIVMTRILVHGGK